MADKTVDLFVVGGGVNGAAIARDAAGRGLSVMLAEKGDYACATSSTSSNLIHGGLRYLETWQFALVRQSLREREILMRAAPYLAIPQQFLVPVRARLGRPAWMVRLGLTLYDLLAGGKSLAASGRLSGSEALPGLRKDGLKAVLHYHDCRTDDARLVLALLLDARERGADIASRREVTRIQALQDGYRVAVTEGGGHAGIDARFVVNAAGPWANAVNALCDAPAPERNLRLVRGSHVVLVMPQPAQTQAYTLQNDDGRVVFTLPWLDNRYLAIGTTDVPHDGDPGDARCSERERDYLLRVYNRYFAGPGGPAGPRDVVWSWSGVRPLVDDGSGDPSKITRSADLTWRARGNGGFITVYGGKLTTHRDLAAEVIARLERMGAEMAGPWTHDAILPGGHLTCAELAIHADKGPDAVALPVRRRWARTYGDRMMVLYDRIAHVPDLAREIAPGLPEAELVHARDAEDAACAEDFLHRRTKLFMEFGERDREAVLRWFGS